MLAGSNETAGLELVLLTLYGPSLGARQGRDGGARAHQILARKESTEAPARFAPALRLRDLEIRNKRAAFTAYLFVQVPKPESEVSAVANDIDALLLFLSMRNIQPKAPSMPWMMS